MEKVDIFGRVLWQAVAQFVYKFHNALWLQFWEHESDDIAPSVRLCDNFCTFVHADALWFLLIIATCS